MTGSAMFYAYNYPNGYASNTGYEEYDQSLHYFIVDSTGKVSLVIAHDKAGG